MKVCLLVSILMLCILYCDRVEGTDTDICTYSLQTCVTGNGPKNEESRYIVRFQGYKLSSYWKSELESALTQHSHRWRWVDRHNPAEHYPTDFGIIQLISMTVDEIQDLLLKTRFVKDIHLDHKIIRSLAVEQSPSTSSSFTTDEGLLNKPPGRLRTRPTMGLDSDQDDYTYDEGMYSTELRRKMSRKLLYPRIQHSVTDRLNAAEIWNQGYTGQKVKVGVFDTGISKDHPHIRNIKKRTNWTHQKSLKDGLGHGSFVAGVIAGQDANCRGFAPDVELYTFKVFTDDQVSYTSWFMDAFNYAIISKVNIVNLSIGGPDYLDHPFVEKVLEVTSVGIIMVSAIGNDGPLYGTLNNPADQNDVIGIGGINYNDRVAQFSSRGMTTWELPLGYGRIKPDVMAYAQDVSGSKMENGCKSLSGTSVASPVAAGAVALLASTIPEQNRWNLLNPASMKQALIEGATQLKDTSIYVQGAGTINLQNSMQILQSYEPRASLIPSNLNLTNCPYMWPFCNQPLYANAAPVILNTTILNGIGVTGFMKKAPLFEPLNQGGEFLDFFFEWSDVLWPWSGYLAIYIRVKPEAKNFTGIASGMLKFEIFSKQSSTLNNVVVSAVEVPFVAEIVPTPDRSKRILWDQFHSVKYPPAYFPRDNLEIRNDVLDWHGDHPHTNFHAMFDDLRNHGFYLEILGSPFTCFNASDYGTLLIVDSEDVFYPEEVAKIVEDVKDHGLGLIIFAEWFNSEVAESFKFFDDNTRSWWTPATGGSNVPAINKLLSDFGIAFGDSILQGNQVFNGNYPVKYASGANIIKFPQGGYLHSFDLEDRSKDEPATKKFHTLGMTSHGAGHVVAYGDSGCLDSGYQVGNCFELLRSLVLYVTKEKKKNELLQKITAEEFKIKTAIGEPNTILPEPMTAVNFTAVSFVLMNPLQCYVNSPNKMDTLSLAHNTTRGDDQSTEVLRAFKEAVYDDGESILQSAKMAISDKMLRRNPYSYGIADRAPPVLLSKWSALFGVLIMIALYRVTRRRRSANTTTPSQT